MKQWNELMDGIKWNPTTRERERRVVITKRKYINPENKAREREESL